VAGRFIGINAFAGGNAMCGCAGHGHRRYLRLLPPPSTGTASHLVVRQDARNVIVHNDGEDDQEKD
jgi:hypothetical protein